MKTNVELEGQIYCKVSAAAKLLGTTPAKIRQLMGDGTLEWTQARVNGQIVVSRDSLVRYMKVRRTGGR
jgi:hypothetical protein